MSTFRILTALFLAINLSFAEDQSDNGAEWLETYYQNPTPEKFLPQMKLWAENGTLRNPAARSALVGFTSQLMRQNRSKIAAWVRELRVGDPEDFVVIDNALYFSRTTEADKLIEASLGRKLEDKDRPSKILERPLNEEPAMNMLWGYFYATGSEKAIRKIIHGFRYVNAPLAPDGVEVPEGYKPYYVELPGIAAGSLLKNMKSDPRVQEICEQIYKKDNTLTKMEELNLYNLLSKRNPEKYPPKESE